MLAKAALNTILTVAGFVTGMGLAWCLVMIILLIGIIFVSLGFFADSVYNGKADWFFIMPVVICFIAFIIRLTH